jgi:hypothetical protein
MGRQIGQFRPSIYLYHPGCAPLTLSARLIPTTGRNAARSHSVYGSGLSTHNLDLLLFRESDPDLDI